MDSLTAYSKVDRGGKGKRPARPLKGLARTQWLTPVVGIV